ncbi:choice-of-anchor D domain-containing protein [Candidatus Binatus sp.]|uniref:choice-of-anchor D domain-containing protein n=2 Tax=Candidatus Binatus sp. TaxID=2811406 RepID=UPI003BAEBC2B
MTAPEIGGSLGPNLLVNGDFSQGMAGWSMPSGCFSLDPTTPAPNGTASLEMSDSAACNNATPIAVNSLKVTSGQVYTISGQLMTEGLVGTKSYAGAMFDLLGYGRSTIMNGTTDWTTTTMQHVTVPAGVNTSFRLQTYGAITSGDAWFANLSMQQEIPPALQMFLLYPNYRGMMFSDQSQVANVDLTVTPPTGTSLSSLQVVLNATDSGGNIVASQTVVPSSTDFTASIDLGALPLGTYQLAGTVEDSSGNVLMTQSPYAIVKLDASARDGMKAWIDPANRAHFLDGDPHFVLGIYDTTQYSLREAYYVPELAAIAMAPINMIINYYITNAPTQAITAYTDAMKQFGITFLPDVAAFYSGSPNWPTGPAKEFGTENQDTLISDYTAALSSDSNIVGYYVGDEPALTRQPQTFHQYGLIKGGDPSGFSLSVFNTPLDLPSWKDTVDILGVDAYPLAALTGNDLAEVADRTRAAVQASHGTRPVWTVIQFFQLDLESAWPTDQQLHDMSWMAIVEGATGLFYWEYGIRGLASIKDPVEHAALYQELIDVTTEIKSLEPVLLSPDAPVISDNSAAGTVFTKTKIGADGSRYLFAYNYTASPVTAEFTLAQPAGNIVDYDTGANNPPDTSTTFSSAFQPYQAHVYLISNSVPVRTPVPSATPSAAATATPSGTPTSMRTQTATATATLDPTPTVTATATASTTPAATATPGVLSVTPAKLKFGAQRLGTTSRPRTLKVINRGAAAVSFTGMQASGDFAQTNNCGASLAALESCTIRVTSRPTVAGVRTGNLQLHDNATNNPQIVTLSGKGNRR